MRKALILKASLFFFICISCLAVSLSISWAAEVIYTQGNVQARDAKDGVWRHAEKGTRLGSGDSLRTAKNSKADVLLDDAKKNVIRVEPATQVNLNSGSPESIDRIELTEGKIYARIENLRTGLDFLVSTPSTVVGVRGTGWSVKTQKKRDEVAVFQSSIYIKTFDAAKSLISEQVVREGFKVSIDRFKAPMDLMRLNAREVENWYRVTYEMAHHIEDAVNIGVESPKSSLERVSDYEEAVKKIDEAKEHLEEQSMEDRTSGSHQDSY